MNWTDYKEGAFRWSIGEGALLMGPLEDGRIIVHVNDHDPVTTMRNVDDAKALAESMAGIVVHVDE